MSTMVEPPPVETAAHHDVPGAAATGPHVSQLVIHADDLGETAEITKGILECIDAGRVTSTSLMANMPATDLAIEEAARRGRQASFGVHLVLCEGPPLTHAPSLTGEDGEFHRKKSLGLRGLAGRLKAEDVERELRAQIRRIADGGVQISHFDSHKHLHQLPVVRDVVARLAVEFGVERIRCTLEDGFWPKGMKPAAWLSRSVRVHLAQQAGAVFKRRQLRHPVRVFDVRTLIALQGHDDRIGLLRRPAAISEMVCHPGTYKADLEKPGSCTRYAEFQFLLDDAFGAMLDEADVELTTFWSV